ncbi:MAG TPA: hypothetical protein VI336_04125, partial [Candidatus Saccharimonadales bacterium]|nr:hypothetical protein [Candidatus Saccharimonadales bacterium]
MATTLSPEQEENKSQIPSEDTPDFLRQRENLDNPDSKDNQPAYNSSDPRGDNAPSTENLNQTEQNGGNPTQHENTIGEGYKPGAGEHHTAPLRSRLLKGRGRKAAVGGSIAALIIVGLIALFIALIPLKILHIVNNLQDRFYSTAQNAVEKQVDNLFSRYLRGKITAGCKGVYIDSSCNPYNGTSFVNRLYRGWSDGRLEEKLRKQTGLEIRKNNLGTYEMKFTGGDTIALDDLKKNKTISEIIDAKGDWTEVKKSQVKGVYKSALKSTTRHASTMYYVKVTPYLAKKFGIKWCVIGCQKGQDFEVWKNKKKFAAKMWLAERVLGPRAELYGMILQCLYAKDEFCSKKSVLEAVSTEYEADTGGCKKGCINNGRHVSPSLQKMEAALVARAASYGSSYAELRKIFEFFEKYGFVGGTLRSILNGINTQGKDKGEQKLKNENELTDKVGKTALQRLGWVVMAAYLVEFINEAPEVMTRLQYEANTAAMAQLWATYRTAPDELKEGEIDAEIYGSFVTSLGPGLQPVDETVIAPENEEEQVGGLAGAEATPLYQAIVSQGSNAPAGVASIINSTLSPQALAAEETSSDYLCKDGNPPPAGKLVCSEEFLNGLGWFGQILKAPEKFVPGWGLIVLASDVITDVIDGIIGKIFDIIGSFLPGFIKDALADAAGEIANLLGQLARFAELDAALKAFAEWMLGLNLNMVSNNMSGGR